MRLLPALLAIAFSLPLVSMSYADDRTRLAQQMLNALGYDVGTPDGVAGPRTKAALDAFMQEGGSGFDGVLDDNEIEALGQFGALTLKIDFEVEVSELYFIDSADINGDSIPDFVMTAMSDPQRQMGVPCCNVTAQVAAKVRPAALVLVYSSPDGYLTQKFPDEANGRRTFAGRFAFSPDGTFFVVGRNGEMGLPAANHGQTSMVFELRPSGSAGFDITKTYEYPFAATTAGIVTWDANGDGYPEILQNNYGQISADGANGRSTVKTLGPDGAISPASVAFNLQPSRAHNAIGIMDADGDGRDDVLAAAEVWKDSNGKTIPDRPGSYLLLSRPDGAVPSPLFLEPAHFGTNHAAFSLAPLNVDGRSIVLEVATEFFGFQYQDGNPFEGFSLEAYELLGSLPPRLVTSEILPKVPRARGAINNYLRLVDLDFDGINEVYLSQYVDRPEFMKWRDGELEVLGPPVSNYAREGWENKQILSAR